MATPAPPAPPVITAPGTPLTPPLAPPLAPPTPINPHNNEDRIFNKLRAAMHNSTPAVAEQAPAIPAAPVVDPAAPVTTPEAAPVATPETPVEAGSPNLDDLTDIDFDAPPPDPNAEPAPKQLLSDAQLAQTLEEKLKGDAVPDEIKEVFLKTSQGKRMLQSFHTLRELEKPPEADGGGGLGRLPTIDEIKAGDNARRQIDAMQFEFGENPQSFAYNLFRFDPDSGINALGANPNHALKVLETIPQELTRAMRETGHPVYAQLMAAYSAPVFTGFLNTQYAEALSMKTESQQQINAAMQNAAAIPLENSIPLAYEKSRRLDALQLVESIALGRARPLNLGTAAPANGAPGESTEVLELRRQLGQERALRQQTEQGRIQGLRSNVENSARTSAMGDIDKVLDQRGITKIHSNEILSPHKDVIYREIHAALPQHDPTGWQNYEMMLARIARGDGDEAATAKQYQKLFRNALTHLPDVRTRLQNLVMGAKATSDSQHAVRQQAALRTEPNGTGVSVPQSVLSAAQIERQPGESKEDYFTRKFANSMANGRPANGAVRR